MANDSYKKPNINLLLVFFSRTLDIPSVLLKLLPIIFTSLKHLLNLNQRGNLSFQFFANILHKQDKLIHSVHCLVIPKSL